MKHNGNNNVFHDARENWNNTFYNAPPVPPPLPIRMPSGPLRAKKTRKRALAKNTRNQENLKRRRQTPKRFSNLDPLALRRIAQLLKKPNNIMAFRAVSRRVRNATASAEPNPFGVGSDAVKESSKRYKHLFVDLWMSSILATAMYVTGLVTFIFDSDRAPSRFSLRPLPKELKQSNLSIRPFERHDLNGRVVHGDMFSSVFDRQRPTAIMLSAKTRLRRDLDVQTHVFIVPQGGMRSFSVRINFFLRQGTHHIMLSLQGVMRQRGKLVTSSIDNFDSATQSNQNWKRLIGIDVYDGLAQAWKEVSETWTRLVNVPFL